MNFVVLLFNNLKAGTKVKFFKKDDSDYLINANDLIKGYKKDL